ncbi:MAG: cbb3-type cytochrome c oxidase subunit II [Planctomycetota bacterium]|nr:cbb3-type cytochrome c oxidase subunit II [Planctomycetota bacterium]MDA1179848.1 cbb3-type cytochrome c oxidase subunit II [Planctomycetota bacterium]
MLESKTGILFVAGIGFFVFAFVANVAVPVAMYKDQPEKTAEEMINSNILYQFTELSKRYPQSFEQAFGAANEENCAKALRLGRQLYIGEGCWHCHSQFVRPVSNESLRYGPVADTAEYQNELQRPVMFGTRRVGPDLSRQGGRHGNDWHAVHFFRPQTLVPESPMPEYPWFFAGSPDKPTRRGLALITYVQWLGSWLDSYPYYEELDSIKSEGY